MEEKVSRIHPEIKVEECEAIQIPAQINLFTGQEEPVRYPVEREFDEEEIEMREGLTLVKSGDTSQLIVSGFGTFLSKVSERLTVRIGKKVVYEFPFFRLSEVTVASKGVTISTDLLQELCQRGIQINFLQVSGKPYAKITSPMLTATIAARRAQIGALESERGAHFAITVVANKINNQSKLLRYFGKYLKQSDPAVFDRIEVLAGELKSLAQKAKKFQGDSLSTARKGLLGMEGASSRMYWEGVQAIVSKKRELMGRVHRGATDEVNSLLNYGYGILYSQVWGAVITAGLEPFAGFMHVDRPGKPSLVLDMVEEFRQPVVDRTVISHINLGEPIKMEGGLLSAETRTSYSQKILNRLESQEVYQGKRYQIRSIIQIQARNLAAYLRGERDYRPFKFRW